MQSMPGSLGSQGGERTRISKPSGLPRSSLTENMWVVLKVALKIQTLILLIRKEKAITLKLMLQEIVK